MLYLIYKIWSINNLKKKILNTIFYLSIYRLGSYIVLPGINPIFLATNHNDFKANSILNIFNMFVGGAFSNFSIISLGIMPYISSSILVQVMSFIIPYFQRLQRDGIVGQNTINQLIRLITIPICCIQAFIFINTQIPIYIVYINYTLFVISSIIILCAGTIAVMWIGEKITSNGIGNGISVIIMTGIIVHFPGALISEIFSKLSNIYGFISIFFELFIFILIMILSIAITRVTREISIQYVNDIIYSNEILKNTNNRKYIPLKLNSSGVMPIILAQAIMFFLAMFNSIINNKKNILDNFNDNTSFLYNITFALLIIIFSYLYTNILMNSTQISDDMKKSGSFIPGISPGIETSSFIKDIINKLTLFGSIFLALIAIIPSIIIKLNITPQLAQFFGGTSLLIIISTSLEIIQQIKSHLLTNYYDELMRKNQLNQHYE